MAQDVRGFEEKGDDSPWCVQCAAFLKWPGHDECHGCLQVRGRPAETVTFMTVHWDTPVIHRILRRKVAVWEQRHPGWLLVPDMQRYWEDSTHPSKYVDRDTTIGRKHAWTRFRVERRHPRGWTRHALGLWVAEHAQFVNEVFWAQIEQASAVPLGWPLRRWHPQPLVLEEPEPEQETQDE